jgi:hypothetical protein
MVSYRPVMMPFALSRPRLLFGVALLAALPLVTAPGRVDAAQAVAVGEVVVTGSGDAAFADGMRTVLVRLTGRRQAANDPVFAPLIAGARRYVQVYRPPSGASPARITFDAAAVERAVTALAQPVWTRTRPVVLGVVSRPPEGADPAKVRTELETAASERGLPLKLASAASAGLAGQPVVAAADALAAARRLGADATLLGTGEGGEWQWTLFEGGATTVFTGSVTAGVEGAADQFALGAAAPSAPGVVTVLEVQGIASLVDVVKVQRVLESLPGARNVTALAVGGDVTRFRLEIPRGNDGLVEALLARPELARVGGASSLVYRVGR